MKYNFTPRALANLHTIADYLYPRNPEAAKKVRAAIYNSIALLISFPSMGQKQNARGVRKWVVQKYPYLLYYRVDENLQQIVVLNIKNQAEQRPYDNAE